MRLLLENENKARITIENTYGILKKYLTNYLAFKFTDSYVLCLYLPMSTPKLSTNTIVKCSIH